MGRIVCLGGSHIRLAPREPDLSLRDVSSFRRYFAGSGAAVSHGVASLSGAAVFLGAIARDPFGQYLRGELRAAGVDLSRAAWTEDADTPLEFSDCRGPGAKVYNPRPPWQAILPEDADKITLQPEDILHIEAGFLHPTELRAWGKSLLGQARRLGCLISVEAGSYDPELLQWASPLLFRDALLFLSLRELESIEAACGATLPGLVGTNRAVLLQEGPEGISCHTAGGALPGLGHAGMRNWDDVRHVYLAGFLCYLSQNHPPKGWDGLGEDRELLFQAMVHGRVAAGLAASKRGYILGATAPHEVRKMLTAEKNEAILRERALLKERAAGDYHRLQYHLMPEFGWMNDPNGLVEFGGQYHAFYQHYPDAAEWGPMHWGHAVSGDLLHWKHLPIALAPDQPYEKGCFSGSAVDNGGELTLLYTAHDDSRSPKETQCVATSRDGVTFEKYIGNPVIPAPPKGLGEDFRDPKVSRVGNKWYMVVGCTEKSLGSIALYASEDLRHWEYKGIACQSDGNQGNMWECPDLFPLDGADVLMCSPMQMKNCKTMFITGAMDYEGCRFQQDRYCEVDYGHEFYAPQTLLDSKGRHILIGWMEMWGNTYPTQKSGWVGALTLPRELFLREGHVCQRPVEETRSLRTETLLDGPLQLAEGSRGNLPSMAADCMELELRAPKAGSGVLTLHLRASADFAQQTLVSYDFGTGRLVVDKRHSGGGRCDVTTVDAPLQGDPLELHLFLDRSSLEVFCGGGRYVVSSRIYPAPDSRFCDIRAEGADIAVENLAIYRL